ncbi:MAG: zinc ribbon domain-containing protein [candidate division Zixibacteria bacterium]|nr:zinc ribbon domain-containing protein [candidate division Zixibacteria bacterium]
MPIFEYKCIGCGHKFEELVPSSFSGIMNCPSCGSDSSEKLFSAFGFVSKSGGDTTASSVSHGCANCASGNCANCGHH